MYFKTKKDSNTGLKFQVVFDKMQLALKEQKEIAHKYGFNQWRDDYHVVSGGISSVVFPNEILLDSKVWKKMKLKYCDNEFYPKASSKLGKEIIKQFNNLIKVSTNELNDCIGFKKNFCHIGFESNNDEYFGFSGKEEWNMIIPEDCVEITTSEWNKLFKK